jgi:hypothetical protein
MLNAGQDGGHENQSDGYFNFHGFCSFLRFSSDQLFAPNALRALGSISPCAVGGAERTSKERKIECGGWNAGVKRRKSGVRCFQLIQVEPASAGFRLEPAAQAISY